MPVVGPRTHLLGIRFVRFVNAEFFFPKHHLEQFGNLITKKNVSLSTLQIKCGTFNLNYGEFLIKLLLLRGVFSPKME